MRWHILPSNQQIVSAGSDGLGRLWQLPVNAPRMIDAKALVNVFALSRDGSKLATAGGDKVVRLWNPADGKSIKEITTDAPVVAIAFQQDGSKIAVALGSKSVRIYQTADGKEVKKIEPLPAADFRHRVPGGRRADCRRGRGQHHSHDQPG